MNKELQGLKDLCMYKAEDFWTIIDYLYNKNYYDMSDIEQIKKNIIELLEARKKYKEKKEGVKNGWESY